MINYQKDNFFERNVDSDIFHGFFSRNGGISKKYFRSLNCGFVHGEDKYNVLKNRELVCREFSMQLQNLKLVNQIHSSKIIEINKNSLVKNGDGMITKDTDLILGILTADCAPIIFSGKQFFGILHVGWKGLFKNIIANLVMILKKKKENISDIICSVGPHITKKSFEVKVDFIKVLDKQKPGLSDLISYKNGKYFFDFSLSIKRELEINGFRKFNILFNDTYSNNKRFFSYRFSKKKNMICGRQISLIGRYK